MSKLTPRFVEDVPDELEPGALYVSPSYRTMLHLCACGCGREVATPLSPCEWNFTFDGETISVSPSVGSWDLPCRSHYVIRRNAVVWAGQWSEERIAAGRGREMREREAYYGSTTDVSETTVQEPPRTTASELTRWRRFIDRMAFWR